MELIKKLKFWEKEKKIKSVAATVQADISKSKLKQEIKRYSATQLWEPSWKSFFVIFLMVLAAGILVHFNEVANYTAFLFSKVIGENQLYWLFEHLPQGNYELSLPVVDKESNHFQNLISIHIGLGAMVFSLAIFIAESFRGKNIDRGRVLLKESMLFPLITAVVLVSFVFAWGTVNVLSVLLVFAIAIFIVASIRKVFQIYMKKSLFKEKQITMFLEVLKKEFVKIFHFNTFKRFGQNILIKELKKRDGIEFYVWPIDETDEVYYNYKAKNAGTVIDIRLDKLDQLLDKVSSKNLKGNLTAAEDDSPITNEVEPLQGKIGNVTTNFYSSVEPDQILLQIEKKLIGEDSELKKDIEKMSGEIFVIKEEEDISKAAREEIKELRLRGIDAIDEKRADELEAVNSLYLKLAEDFLGYLEEFGGGFSPEQAQNEMGLMFNRFEPITWLNDDIHQLFERAMKSFNWEVIREAAYLPIRIVRTAVDSKDHYLFREFLYYPRALYQHGVEIKKKDEKLGELVIDRSCRYLTELVQFHLGYKIKDEDFDLEDFKEFSIYILKVFQGLIKAAFDLRDLDSFNKFKEAVEDILENLQRPYRIRRRDGLDEIVTEIETKKQEMFFGVAAWILFKYEQIPEDQDLKSFFNATRDMIPWDLDGLTKLFIRSHDFDIEKYWNWDNWEMEGKREGRVHGIQILEKLEKLYAIRALQILSGKENIEGISLPPSRDLAFLAEGTRDLKKILEDIKTKPENWEFVLNEASRASVDKLETLLNKAKDDQEEIEKKMRREAPLSLKKVSEFKEAVINQFKENATMRRLFREFNSYEDKTDESVDPDKKGIGLSTMMDKGAFMDDWHVNYVGAGGEFASAMTRGENDRVLKDLKEKSEEWELDDLANKLDSLNHEDYIIIGVNGATFSQLNKLEKFKRYWEKPRKYEGQEGWYGDIPVFRAIAEKGEKRIFVLNTKTLPKLIQLAPKSDGDWEKNETGISIKVRAYSEESQLLEDTLDKPMDWLKEKGNKEEQKKYLLERAVIDIFDRFEVEFGDDFEGYYVEVNND